MVQARQAAEREVRCVVSTRGAPWTCCEHWAIVWTMQRWLCLLALLGACSLTGIHYPDNPTQPIDCERLKVLPVLDTGAALGALATSAYIYKEQTKTSPWPLSALVGAAWAIASASYGFYETGRCRSQMSQPLPSATAFGLNQP
jgi:hypothetical protein